MHDLTPARHLARNMKLIDRTMTLILVALWQLLYSHQAFAEPASASSERKEKWGLEDKAVEGKVKSYILEKVQIGTGLPEAIVVLEREFGKPFVRHDPNNGITLPESQMAARRLEKPVGVQSLSILVSERQFGEDNLMSERLYALLGFDGKGRLIAVETHREMDGL